MFIQTDTTYMHIYICIHVYIYRERGIGIKNLFDMVRYADLQLSKMRMIQLNIMTFSPE